MQTFTDCKGDKWRLSITIGHIKPVEAETGVNLLKMDKPFSLDSEDWQDDAGNPLVLMTRLELDTELLCSVIFALCVEQIAERGIDEVEFGKRLGISEAGHDAYADAFGAFWTEAQSFFRQTRREHVATMISKQRETLDRAMAKVAQLTEENINTDKIVADVEARVRSMFGSSFGPTPALSESTRDN